MAKGFTLLETIIAVAILATGIVASLTLVSKSIRSVSVSQNRLVASYLAQEGLELVRNARDNNWKDSNYPTSVNWDDGWSDCTDCEIDYTVNTVSDIGDPVLKLDTSNFYNYTSGTDTIFKRRVTVVTIVANEQKQIISEVAWIDRGNNYSMSVEGYLYNWQ